MLTQEQAHSLFEYKDGALYWKNSQRPSLNGKKAGYDNGNGYFKVNINGKQYFNHRIIYLMQHGYIPKLIDHIDGNPTNNKIENLRIASSSENAMNSLRKQKNASGCKNVFYNKNRNKYYVYIKIDNKVNYFGTYDDIELAELVAIEARNKFQGIFAKHN
jgi:hypothetical protein